MHSKEDTYQNELNKMIAFCSYSERCTNDVILKLNKSTALDKSLIPQLITELKLNDYLNELRYARSYAFGKNRYNKWGKLKIKQGLFTKFVDSKVIDRALMSIDENDYLSILQHVIDQKWAVLKDNLSDQEKIKKAVNFCLNKGFESYLIWPLVQDKLENK